jgi:hypothetical protein
MFNWGGFGVGVVYICGSACWVCCLSSIFYALSRAKGKRYAYLEAMRWRGGGGFLWRKK